MKRTQTETAPSTNVNTLGKYKKICFFVLFCFLNINKNLQCMVCNVNTKCMCATIIAVSMNLYEQNIFEVYSH